MIQFKELKVLNKLSIDFLNIQFEIEDTVEDLTNYRFDLLRSNSPSGVFETVMTGISNFECNDYTVNLLNPEIKYFYKIRAYDFKNNEELISDIIDVPTAPQDNYTYYFDSIYNQYLDIINNSEVYLLKRMRTGELCECYDDVRGSRKTDKCQICFGTGYKGGFYQPIKMKVNYFNAPTKSEDMSPSGSFESQSPIQLWTVNYPVIQENDIIVDTLTGQRSIVTSWQPSYKNGYLIRQTVQAQKIPESSLFYKIPI